MSPRITPDYVKALQSIYGPPSDSAWGSAVFFEKLDNDDSFESSCLDVYRNFIGKLWDRFGEQAWMSGWGLAHSIDEEDGIDVVEKLTSSKNDVIKLSAPILIDNKNLPSDPRPILHSAFDPDKLVDLRIYTIGDGAELSGLMIAGRRNNGEATFLVFLLD